MTSPIHAKIQVVFRANGLADPIAIEHSVNNRIFDLSPLPAEHDAFPLFRDEIAERAIHEKKTARLRIAREIANKLAPVIADAILDTISQQDPVRGYPREHEANTTC